MPRVSTGRCAPGVASRRRPRWRSGAERVSRSGSFPERRPLHLLRVPALLRPLLRASAGVRALALCSVGTELAAWWSRCSVSRAGPWDRLRTFNIALARGFRPLPPSLRRKTLSLGPLRPTRARREAGFPLTGLGRGPARVPLATEGRSQRTRPTSRPSSSRPRPIKHVIDATSGPRQEYDDHAHRHGVRIPPADGLGLGRGSDALAPGFGVGVDAGRPQPIWPRARPDRLPSSTGPRFHHRGQTG